MIREILAWANNSIQILTFEYAYLRANESCDDSTLEMVKKHWRQEGVWPLPAPGDWKGSVEELCNALYSGCPRRKICSIECEIAEPPSDDWTTYDWDEMRRIVTDEVDAIEAFLSRQAKNIGRASLSRRINFAPLSERDYLEWVAEQP